METPRKLTRAQAELLALFDQDVPDDDWMTLRRLIARFFAERATGAADAVAREKGWTDDDFDALLNAHHRASG